MAWSESFGMKRLYNAIQFYSRERTQETSIDNMDNKDSLLSVI